MSLGAIDFGILVDGAVIIIEEQWFIRCIKRYLQDESYYPNNGTK